nr:helix-turn-helix domain-containing protein [Kineosporia sp. NBRC 101731]
MPMDVMQILGFSRSTTYEVIRSGRLPSVVEGSTRFVTERGITEYIALLEREAQQDHNEIGRAA